MVTSLANRASPPQPQLNSLLEHYQNGRYEDAEKLAMFITEQFPHHQFSWKVLGAVLGQAGRKTEALVANQKSVELGPKDAAAHSNLGSIMKELGRLEEAEASYRQAIALKSDYPDAHNNLGITLQEIGKLQEAKASYRQAIAVKPDFAAAHSNLGNTLNELGRLEEAEASYRQAIELKPDYALAHSNLGNTLRKLGRLDEAEASYRQAIAVKPDFAAAHSNLGITLKDLGRFDQAEASSRQAIELKPDFAEAHRDLGNTLRKLGRLDEAEASYRQAIAVKPDYAEAHNNLGITLKDLGRFDQAEASSRQAIALKPDFAAAQENLGIALQALGKLQDAEVCYKKYISLKPDHTSLMESRGTALFNEGKFERALSDFDDYNTKDSRACALEALYALGRIEDIYQRIETHAKLDDDNLKIAAFASFIAERQNKDTAYNFCRNPLDFLHFANLSSHSEDPNSFITQVINELYDVPSVWEDPIKPVQKGFQTMGDLFRNPKRSVLALKSIIFNEIDSYYAKFKNETCSFIKKWPVEKNILAWHVILKKHGYQSAHIHPSGWLSGVIYLKTVPSLGKDEGAIEFNLAGPRYFDTNSPKITYIPKMGDIILFPSSLHHRTIPFTTDTDRIIVSFDLEPKVANY